MRHSREPFERVSHVSPVARLGDRELGHVELARRRAVEGQRAEGDDARARAVRRRRRARDAARRRRRRRSVVEAPGQSARVDELARSPTRRTSGVSTSHPSRAPSGAQRVGA